MFQPTGSLICAGLRLFPGIVFLGLVIAGSAVAEEMRVTDLPIADGATNVTQMKRRGDVRYKIESQFKAVGSFYTNKLLADGWKKSKRDNLQRNFWVQSFSKGSLSLEVRVDGRNSGSEVRLTPTGLMWEEDDQPTPKDLPLPDDAADIKLNEFSESIEFRSPSDVKTVVKQMSAALVRLKWKKVATPFDLPTFVRMKFALSKSTLDIDVRADDGASEVRIRTHGMQWDGMKEEIARAEAKAKAASHSTAKSGAPEKVEKTFVPSRKRKERTAKIPDDLPEVNSEATVVMDGTPFSLPHVIAYEVFEHDEWSTKIVATQKPVKQATLLAKLRKTGTDWDEDENPPNWPEPYLQVRLDEDDKPDRMSFLAKGTPGSGSDDELSGDVLAGDGRVRGTLALKEPGSFFDKVYTAKISFDVPVLTRKSTAAKRLLEVPQLASLGTLKIGKKSYKLSNVLAYRTKLFDDPVTAIVLSQKPLNLAKLKAALKGGDDDEYFEFTPQIKLLVDADDIVKSLFIWADNISISSNTHMKDDIVIEDGRVRGTAKTTQPGKFFDDEYSYDVSFDLKVMESK